MLEDKTTAEKEEIKRRERILRRRKTINNMGYGEVYAWWEEDEHIVTDKTSLEKKNETIDWIYKSRNRTKLLEKLKEIHGELAYVPLIEGEGVPISQWLWMSIFKMEENEKRQEEWKKRKMKND